MNSQGIKSRSNFRKILHRFFSRKLAVFGLIIVVAMILFALFGSYLTPFTFAETNTSDRYQGPNAVHWFGTDDLGRDMYARVVDGIGPLIAIAGVGLSESERRQIGSEQGKQAHRHHIIKPNTASFLEKKRCRIFLKLERLLIP